MLGSSLSENVLKSASSCVNTSATSATASATFVFCACVQFKESKGRSSSSPGSAGSHSLSPVHASCSAAVSLPLKMQERSFVVSLHSTFAFAAGSPGMCELSTIPHTSTFQIRLKVLTMKSRKSRGISTASITETNLLSATHTAMVTSSKTANV